LYHGTSEDRTQIRRRDEAICQGKPKHFSWEDFARVSPYPSRSPFRH
jgi:hypothetical protein